MMRPPFRMGMMAGMLAVLTALPATAADLRDAAPPDVFLATFHKKNPEREFLDAHYQAIWDTVEETQILSKVWKILEARIPERELAQFAAVRQQIEQALEPASLDTLGSVTESLYAQQMSLPMAHHLVLLKMTDNDAKALATAGANLMGLVEQFSNGQVPVVKDSIGNASYTTLGLPPQVPFRPLIGTSGDVFFFATSPELLKQSLDLLNGSGGKSKFDDPRVKLALGKLPRVEDGLTFFDGANLFDNLGGVSDLIRQAAGGDPEAERVVGLIETALSEFGILDFEVTVEYTEGHQTRSAAFGKLKDGAKDSVLMKMVSASKPFDNWASWVPANATGYTLSRGASLHPLYEWLMTLVEEKFPEAGVGLAQFEAIQDGIDFHLDRDIFQAFSGESVSITLPGAASPFGGGGGKSVAFIKCSKPERIMELVHRLVDQLQQIPQLQTQGVGLKEVPDMEGFEELTAGFFAIMGLRPVIGHTDGWLVLSSHADAVSTVLETRKGEQPSVAGTDEFKEFNLDINGPVDSISYSNVGESTRQLAQGIGQAGAMLPLFLSMAGQNANAEELKPIQEFLALLPSVGKIIAKFDFVESRLSVTLPGDVPQVYIRHSITKIRPPQ